MKRIFLIILFIVSIFFPVSTFAQENSFVSVVNPIRGADFWDLKNQKVEDAVLGQAKILDNFQVSATWLIRFDALNNGQLMDMLNKRTEDEKGIFLEVTPSWTESSNVKYRNSISWHNAGSAFLSGYNIDEREKLIDAAFEKFKQTFSLYPKSVGAWWIDAHSLSYMKEKYEITSALIVADQYSTDNYQIWGQFWSTPYYPSKTHALHPAQSVENKIPVVITQWAIRDPVNGYGSGVEESTFSLQANDYMDYHDLDISYFAKLLDIYTKQEFNQFAQIVVGLENSYDFEKYGKEYENQIKVLADKKNSGQISLVTLSEFANWYTKTFPKLSPEQVVISDDPLGSSKKVVWFMNPYYRAGWFFNRDGSVFRDIRQYIDSEEELCLRVRCDLVNFATFATRVLDQVSFGHKWIIDEGKISDFKAKKLDQGFSISYKNEAGKIRVVEFLPRDISIDGKISSIDQAILEATKYKLEQKITQPSLTRGSFQWSLGSSSYKVGVFLLFLILGCIVPGFFMINKLTFKEDSFAKKLTLATILGFVLLTLLFYILGLLKLQQLIFIYFAVNALLLIKNYKSFSSLRLFNFQSKLDFGILGLILAGSIFQQLPSFKNGLIFPYGMGLWGPNTHDGIWHLSLINQLIKSVPAENPIFSKTSITNYHYFYDLLIAATSYVSGLTVLDLIFRFYPFIFSILLGAGTYYLIQILFKEKIAALFGLYLVYFAGSFGWVVDFIKGRQGGGESAFWANQSISFNLNPPFAISLLIVIAILQLLFIKRFNILSVTTLTILIGSLIAFKAYGGVLILLSLLLVGLIKKSISYLVTFSTSLILSLVLFLSNFNVSERLIYFSPFWFVHSMIDSPDRVGWVRLSLARITGFEQGNLFKFTVAEAAGFLIFLIGNLGTRAFAIFGLLNIRNIVRHQEYITLLIFCLLSILIPTIVIQAGNPWNTIQFIYYGLYISAIVSGAVMSNFLRINRALATLVILPMLIITPINAWATASGYLSYQPHAKISNDEIGALEFLKSQEDGVVLTYPYDEKLKQKFEEPWPLFMYDSTAYVSALSQKASFLEDIPQNEILLTDYKKRIVGSKDFFSGQNTESNEFLKKSNIRYIYLPKTFGVILDESLLTVNRIFENKEVLIYQVK